MWRLVPILVLALPFWWFLPLTGLARAGAALAGGTAAYLAIAWSLRRGLTAAITTPFKMKGAVLRGARVEIHGVERIDPSSLRAAEDAGDAEDAEDAGGGDAPLPAEAWRVEATITPVAAPGGGGGFRHWQPGELQLVPASAAVGPDAPRPPDDVTIHRIDVEEEGRWIADEGMKYAGQQRLRVSLSCARPQPGPLAFRYYFEKLGELRLG